MFNFEGFKPQMSCKKFIFFLYSIINACFRSLKFLNPRHLPCRGMIRAKFASTKKPPLFYP